MAQVAGAIVAELGSLDFKSHRGQPCRFFGFRMEVSRVYSDWSENSRQRQWVRTRAAGSGGCDRREQWADPLL
jgi:hypothetical protein